MREIRDARECIFDLYAEQGYQLRGLSDLLDEHPQILTFVEQDLVLPESADTGANGLSVESVLRCLLLKQTLQVSYEHRNY